MYSLPLWIESVWVELGRWERPLEAPHPAPAGWPRVLLQGVGCGLAVAAILVFRSSTTVDFIYFQF